MADYSGPYSVQDSNGCWDPSKRARVLVIDQRQMDIKDTFSSLPN